MKTFLTGATGYVGRQIIRDLVTAHHTVVALVRKGSEGKLPREVEGKIQIVHGDVLSADAYRKAVENVEAIINLPGLLREFPRQGITFEEVHFLGTKVLVDEAKAAGVQRFIQMSALGVRAESQTKYQQTKFRAEEYVKASGLRWTIFRPSSMFGNEKEGFPNFISAINGSLDMFRFFVPVLGNGKYRFQPVALQNVSAGFVKALVTNESTGKTYDVAGPDRYSYNDLLNIVQQIKGKHKIKMYQPMIFIKALASALGRWKFFPVSRDQITMLEEENISDHWKDFFDDFGIVPLRLIENIHRGF
jgi:uncharacterized protein YbjT (DUF2867 family)